MRTNTEADALHLLPYAALYKNIPVALKGARNTFNCYDMPGLEVGFAQMIPWNSQLLMSYLFIHIHIHFKNRMYVK